MTNNESIEHAVFTQRFQKEMVGSFRREPHDLIDICHRIGAGTNHRAEDLKATLAIMIIAECDDIGISIPDASPLILQLVRSGLIYLGGQLSKYHVNGTNDDKLEFAAQFKAESAFERNVRVEDLFMLMGHAVKRFLVQDHIGSVFATDDLMTSPENATSPSVRVVDAIALANKLRESYTGQFFTVNLRNPQLG